MRAGSLRHPITIEEASTSRDAMGNEHAASHKTIARMGAQIETVSLREEELYRQREAVVTHRLRTRYMKGIKAHMRIRFGSRTFEIVDVVPIGNRHRDMKIIAKELEP